MATRFSRLGDEAAFTLIELLVVILIIGILLAIALPTFLSQADKAKDTDVTSKLNTAYKAAKASSTDRGGAFVRGSFTSTDLLNEIIANEPQMVGAHVVTSNSPSGIDAGHLHLIDDPLDAGDTSDNDLALAFRSESGTVYYLRIVDLGGVDLDTSWTYDPS